MTIDSKKWRFILKKRKNGSVISPPLIFGFLVSADTIRKIAIKNNSLNFACYAPPRAPHSASIVNIIGLNLFLYL